MLGEAQGEAAINPSAHVPDLGRRPAEQGFDRSILGRVFLHAAVQSNRLGDSIGDHLGLDRERLTGLSQYLGVDNFCKVFTERNNPPEDEELMVRALLLRNSSFVGPVGEWLACIIARRSLEGNHLWEDLGLATRSDLSRLLARHFAGIAVKNTRNMRWKKFLYRALCEGEGFSMCPSPTCDSCAEFDVCYSDDSGASALARNKKSGAT